jgi:hypothetical protein
VKGRRSHNAAATCAVPQCKLLSKETAATNSFM